MGIKNWLVRRRIRPRIFLVGLPLLGLLYLAGLLVPPCFPRTWDMERYDSQHFSVWAEPSDRRVAIELRSLLEDRGGRALDFLAWPGFPPGLTEVFVYPDRLSFTLHRAGLWAAWSDKAGVVAIRRAGRLLLVSPDHPGLSHSHNEVLHQAMAVWIRTLLPTTAATAGPWLSEGVVEYLAGFSRDDESPDDLPDDRALTDQSTWSFLATGGDRFADSLVAWIVLRYGQEGLLRLLVSGGDWRGVTGQPLEASAAEWRDWLRHDRPNDPRLGSNLPPVSDGQ